MPAKAKAKPKSDPRRNADLAAIHMAAKTLFGDVSKGAPGREDYEDWLEGLTGKRSAGKLTTPERIDLIKGLRTKGLIPDRRRAGIGQTRAGDERPTTAQWNKIGGMARDMGWDGLEAPELRAFVERTAKVASPRFLSRRQASEVILGLEGWLRQKAEGRADAMP